MQADKQSHEVEQNFFNFFQQNPLTMVLSSIEDGIMVEVNDAFVRNLGYKREQIIGKSSVELGIISKDSREHIKNIIMSGGEVCGLPISLCRANGVWLETLLYTKVISYRGEKCLFTTGQDITELKHTEEALRHSEERFRTIYENAPVLINSFDKNGRCLLWNNQCREVFGWTIDEINAHDNPLSLFYPDPAVRDEVMQTIAKPNGRFREWHPVTKDGQTLTNMWASYRLPDGTVISLGYDITKRKQTEKKILKLNETLEQRIAERTASLENRTQQLQQLALEMSYAEDRERRRIASILHDDFQQELAYIKMQLGMILQKNVDQNVRQQLDIIVQLLGKHIEKSRNLSYEINSPVLHRKGLLAALDVLAQGMKDKHGLEVEVRTHPSAKTDSPILAKILYRAAQELLFNVVKHAGVDSASLDVYGKSNMIHIRVEDFGNGFDYDAVRDGQGSGTGFGLYNIEDRMTFLGGSMKIKTAPGKGCCVVLTVPKDVSRKTDSLAPPPEDTVNN